EIAHDAKDSRLKREHMAVASPLSLRKNNQTGAAVERLARPLNQPPQTPRGLLVRDGDIFEALHQSAVNRNLEVGLEFPAAEELRNCGIEHERIKQVDVIRDEDAGAG